MRRALMLILTGLGLVACGATPQGPTSAPTSQPKAAAPVDRSELPTPGPDPVWRPAAVQTWTMDNGMQVWLLPQRQAPLLSLRVVFDHGAATDPVGRAGLTSLMVDLLDEGAGGKTSLALGDAFQRLATDFNAMATTDGVLVQLDLLADTLGPSLSLMADILRRPDFLPAEFDRRQHQRVAQALAAEADPSRAASVVMRRALYGDGYGAHPAGGVRGSLMRLTLAGVKAQYEAVIQPKGAVIVAVGDVDRATLRAALDEALGDWRGAPTAVTRPVSKKLPRPGVYFVDFPGNTQSALTVARRAPGTAAPDYFPALLFNRANGGSFTGRLNMNLREDKGYTYGARSAFHRWRQAGTYVLGAKVKSETTRASLDEIKKELDGFKGARPITQVERDKGVQGLLLSLPGRFETLGRVAGQLASLALDGRRPGWLRAWPDEVGAVTLAQANEAARRYAGWADFVIIVAGDRAKVAPTLESLGLPIFPYDAQGNPTK